METSLPPIASIMDRSEIDRLGAELQRRGMVLLQEIEQYMDHVKTAKFKNVQYGDVKSVVQTELKHLSKVLSGEAPDKKAALLVTASNLPFYESLWSVAKTCTGITGLRRPFYSDKPKRGQQSERRATAEIVANHGSEWIKISNINEKRIIHQLAKSGWAPDSDDEEEDGNIFDDEEGILKTMTRLGEASRNEKVNYRNPTIRLILGRVHRDSGKAVQDLLSQIRALGITIETSEDLPAPTPLNREILDKMTAEQPIIFSSTLNIDCSVLLGLVSDISHKTVESKDWHNAQISRQIKRELGDLLLPRTLWPACGGRKLVCTRQAAEKMQDIVNTLGTETERSRMALILGTKSQEDSVREFQTMSDYKVPQNWQLPLEIIDVTIDGLKKQISSGMDEILNNMLDVNQATFMYGWTAGLTTMTSNGLLVKQIKSFIERNDIPETDAGFPEFWICPIPRSLVGKEKQKRMGAQKENIEGFTDTYT